MAITSAREHAAAILDWLGDRTLAAVEAGLADGRESGPLLAHADALADAADADDEGERSAGLQALFAGLVEPLNDGFTPAGRALYARLFARVVWRVASRDPALRSRLATLGVANEAALLERHRRLRGATPVLPTSVTRLAVLSRVTLGADILITSLALQRLHQHWPNARIDLFGDAKLAPLLGGLPGVTVRPITYGRRGPLRERLAAWPALVDAIGDADLVVNPDSRLDQLGLLPVTVDPDRTWLWENLRPEGAEACSLADRFDDWLVTRLGAVWGRRCLPAIGFDASTRAVAARLAAALGPRPICAVKLDHGGNPAKSLPRAAELDVLRGLRERGWRVLLDRGFGGSELANSDAVLASLGWETVDLDDTGTGLGLAVDGLAPGSLAEADSLRFHGSIAGWAAGVAACSLAVSYDSVGHHLAAALGVPLVVAFTGHDQVDFPVAWQPRGKGAVTIVTIDADRRDEPAQWQRVVAALPRTSG